MRKIIAVAVLFFTTGCATMPASDHRAAARPAHALHWLPTKAAPNY